MSVFKSAASVLLALLQLLFASVSYKQIDVPAPEKEEPSAVVNDIDGDTPLADSIKYAKTCEDVPTAAYTTGKRQYYGMKNSSAYIDGWIKAFQGDQKLIIKAAPAAEKAPEKPASDQMEFDF